MIKNFKFQTKHTLFWYFGIEFEKNIVILELSALKLEKIGGFMKKK